MSGAVSALALHAFMVYVVTPSPFIHIGPELLFAIFVISISVGVEDSGLLLDAFSYDTSMIIAVIIQHM
jgi:hypothetical protein